MDESILDADVVNEKARVYIPAGAGLRFVGYFIDMVAYFALCLLAGIVLGITGMIHLLDGAYANLYAIAVLILYYVLLESITGRTLGKLITGTKVLNENDQPPSFLNTVGRTLCRLIPFDAFSYLGSGYGWHDSFSKTKVVKV